MSAWLLGTRLYILIVIAACFSATVAGSAYAEIQEPPSLQRFTSGGHVLGFDEAGYFTSNGTYALRVRFEGASGSSGSVVGTSPGTGTSGATASAVPEFEGISYEDVWPGIGVEYDAPKGGIARSTWTVAPGADPKTIQLRYNRPVALTGNGSLQIGFETGIMTESAPIAWQDVDGKRQPVEVSFATTDDDLVGFAVGAYRRDLPLVIDPTLQWNTFLGGGGNDYGRAIAADATGNVYVGGYSTGSWGSPVRAYSGGSYEAFAAKLDSAGNLLWNTFLGGSGTDIGYAIAVDASGNVYVGGRSTDTWGSPVRAYTAGSDAFAAKLAPSGNLLWNTFLGGSNDDLAEDIAVDASGNVYVSGYSNATWGSPVRAYTAGIDAFATKLDQSGNLLWNTLLGGSGTDSGEGIAVDASGNVYVGGYSTDTWGSPVRAYTAGTAGFAAKLDPSGNLLWNTFLGGSGTDWGYGIAVDASGNVYVSGYSDATWGSPERAYTAGSDAFAAKLDPSGNLAWNTFLGGSGLDEGYAIAVDASGNVYVGGDSSATWGSPERAYTAGLDAFAAKLDSSGNLLWNTFLGGSGDDYGSAIAVDAIRTVYVSGYSTATWGSPERAYTGSIADAFAAMIYQQFCGNSVIDPGEDCDDGNADDGDCCSSTCTFETAGSTCLDDDLCNGTETCDGAGNCDAGAPLDCSDADLCTQESCDPVLGCQNPTEEPATGCVEGWGKGMLLVKETVSGKEKLIAKFIKGPEILAPEFGNPSLVAGTAYTTCIYDDQGALVERLEIDRAGYLCGSKVCWLDMGPRGFLYRDSEASADGVSQARLVAGPSGRSRILLKAANNSKKSQIDLPTGISLGLSNSTSATIQLFGSDTQSCFSLTLGNVKKQEVDMFKAVK